MSATTIANELRREADRWYVYRSLSDYLHKLAARIDGLPLLTDAERAVLDAADRWERSDSPLFRPDIHLEDALLAAVRARREAGPHHESDQSRYASECSLCETDGHLHMHNCPNNPRREAGR